MPDNYTQDITLLPSEQSLPSDGYLYGEKQGFPKRIPSVVFPKRTIWDYATSQQNDFAVPGTQDGEVGDEIVITTGTGTGGEVWILKKIVTNLGTTTYIWDKDILQSDYPKPSVKFVTLVSSGWNTSTNTLTINNIPGYTLTANTKVDVDIDATAYAALVAAGCSELYVENNDGTLLIHALDAVPTSNITVQLTLQEVTQI